MIKFENCIQPLFNLFICLLIIFLCWGHGIIDEGFLVGLTAMVLSCACIWPIWKYMTKKLGEGLKTVILIVSFLIAVCGAFLSLSETFKSETPEVLRTKWEMKRSLWRTEHPSAVLASNELKYRFENHLCAICGKPAKWVLRNIDTNNNDNEKFELATDIQPKEEKEGDEFACEDHTDYLNLIKNGKDGESREYRISNYQGPGQSEIGMAWRDGPVMPGGDEAPEGDLAWYVGLSTFSIGWIAFLFFGLIIRRKEKLL
jgi:hypothetical protein